MSNLSNYPPGVTGADIEEHFGDADEETCDICGKPLEDGVCPNETGTDEEDEDGESN
jgi:hypothetical protein